MNVRRLSGDDAALWCSAVAAVLDPEDRSASAADVAAVLADSRCYLFVATYDDAPVGLLTAYRFPDVTSVGEIVYLYDIEVLETHRRRGLGARLVKALIECCERDQVKLI